MSEIPDGWINIPLDELGDWGSGGTPKRTNQRYYQDGEIPWLIIGDLNDGIVYSARTYITEEGLQNSSTKLLPINTILIAMYGSIGKLGITGFECATNQAIAFCKPNADIVILKYLFYCLMESKNALIAQGQGGAQQNISQGVLKAHTILLAPLNEQQRIADKLDRLLAKVDNCRERIDRISLILERFRQSVLAAATSGKLTEDWRTEKESVHINENKEGDSIKFDFIDTYCFGDYTFPASWQTARLSEITEIVGGITKDSKKESQEDEELPYLRVANVQRGFLNLSEIKTIRVRAQRVESMLLKSGDILFNEGGDIDKLGRGWIWSGEIERCTFQNHVFRVRLENPDFEPKFFSWYGNSRGFNYFLSFGKQTTNLASINKSVLSALPIVIPPAEEQQEIVQRVEKLFAFADRLEARYKTARAQIDKLTLALLAKAFQGELVPQDPTDEPAADLLTRIQQARANPENHPPKQPKTPRKPPSPKITMLNRNDIETSHLADILKNNGTLTAESLWNISKLSIDDFYDQLKDEELQGLLKETIAETSNSLRLLEAI